MSTGAVTRASSLLSLAVLGALVTTAAVAGTQQDKMTACSKDASAKNLSGDARKSFMSDCLKAKSPAPTKNG